jgi:hypothetical protein
VISSPGNPLTDRPTTNRAAKTTRATIAWPVRWAESFSSAIRRRDVAVVATNSMLPLRASVASVPERARTAQRLTMIGKNDPYLYWR